MELMLLAAIVALLVVVGSWWFFSREPKHKPGSWGNRSACKSIPHNVTPEDVKLRKDETAPVRIEKDSHHPR